VISEFTTVPRPALDRTQLTTQCVTQANSLGIKRQGREADHSPPSSAEAEHMGMHTPSHSPTSHGLVFRQNDNFVLRGTVASNGTIVPAPDELVVGVG
jgi:hypothetical protein